MKKKVFLGLSLLACATFSLASCVKTTQGGNQDNKTSETPASESKVNDNQSSSESSSENTPSVTPSQDDNQNNPAPSNDEGQDIPSTPSNDETKEYVHVTFYSNGGTFIGVRDVEKGAKVAKPTNPVKESTVSTNYEFEGWYLDNNTFQNKFDFENDVIDADMALYAKYTESVREYNVTFVDENGNIIETQKLAYGSDIAAPQAPVKDADLEYTYTFDNWYTSNNTSIEELTVSGNLSFAPKYNRTAKKYNITWVDENDNTLLTKNDVVYSDEFEGVLPTKAPSGEYVYELEWVETINENNITRKASFKAVPKVFNVTWKMADGTVLEVDENVAYNSTLSFDGTLPTVANKMFAFWSKDGVNKYDLSTKATAEIELIAVYKEYVKVGFGQGLTPWTDLRTQAGVSGTTAFGKDVSLNGFTFVGSKQRLDDNSTYNSQGGSITVELTGDVNELHLSAVSASKDAATLTVKKGDQVIYTLAVAGSGKNASFDLVGLSSGTYTITFPKDGATGSASIKATTLYVATPKQYVNVLFEENGGSEVTDQQVLKNGKLASIPTPVKSGYRFEGWYLSSDNGVTLDEEVDLNTVFADNTTVYAKWHLLTEDEMASVSFGFNINGVSLSSLNVEKNKSLVLPTAPEVSGYRFEGWYSDSSYSTKLNDSVTITGNKTIYGKYIKLVTVTFLDANNQVLAIKTVDYETAFSNVEKPTAPYIENKLFDYWVLEGTTTEFTATDDVTSNIVLTPVYKNVGSSAEKIVYQAQEGLQESAYFEFKKYTDAESYALYEVGSNDSLTKLTEKDCYLSVYDNKARFDVFGLTEGNHKFLVAPVLGGTDALGLGTYSDVLNVEAYDRSGFAHFNYTDGVGAYKDNGQLKDNAIVLYVTDQNKNTVELTYGGITVKGIGNILNSVGADVGGGLCSNGGSANTNQGIIKKLAENNIPLVVRFVGCVSNTGLYQKATFNAASTPLIDGLTIYDSTGNGGTVGDNGHMARMKSGKDITLEGVGSSAIIDGWGFHFIAESSAPELGKSFEVRNLTFINTPEDAIGMEGNQVSKNASSDLSASVERCWIHNNEMYGPHISNPAESDKAEGDGSCDFKRGQYLTVSYNYFEGCHKTNLVGSADYSLQFNLTYHHNYWYMCKARGPLTRRANVHMYNNVFYGQTDYSMNTRADAYIYSEYNLFYACKSPQAVEGGAIKSYNDSISSVIWNKGTPATVVTSKDQVVANNCQFSARGIKYDKFDTDSTLSYIPSNNYYLQEDITEARKVIYARCGVAKTSLIDINNVTMNDISYLNEVVSNATVHQLSVPTELTNIGKISKTIYAFEITDYATVTIDTEDNGVLVNEAGVVMVEGNGTAVLAPGKYMVQALQFQPGDSGKLTQLVFKEFNLKTLKLEAYDSAALSNALKAQFVDEVSSISNVEYTDACYNSLKKAQATYNSIPAQAKNDVADTLATLNSKMAEFKTLGKTYVEGLIDAIPATINANNSSSVIFARNEYNTLVNRISDVVVSNYSKLVAAEEEMKSIAIQIFVSLVDAIPTTITYTTDCKNALINAESAYANLDEDQIKDSQVVSAYAKLQTAIAKYDSLENVGQVNTLIANANSLTTYKAAYDAYNELTATEKASVVGYTNMLINYTIAAIDDIGTVTEASGDKIVLARSLYNEIDSASKPSVTNYSTLTAAESAYEALAASIIKWSYDGKYTSDSVSCSGNKKTTAATFGSDTYSSGLKMESSAGEITITITKTMKLTVYQTGGTSLKIDGTAVDVSKLVDYELSAGTHKITKGSGSAYVYAILLI